MSNHRRTYRARWLFPVDTEPIPDGGIEIEDGIITAISAVRDPHAHDLGNVAVIPGLVNTHAHLEFSDLSEPLGPSAPFADWIRSTVGHRRSREHGPIQAIRQGYGESAQAGVTLLGEIATTGWTPDAFDEEGPQVVVFRELLGLLPEQGKEQLQIARDHLAAGDEGGNLVRGISPHAPYSVEYGLFRKLVALAAESAAPLAFHLAETPAELELLADGTGELVQMLKDFGVWHRLPASSAAPLDYLREMALLNRGLVIHGNYLSDDEIGFLARHPNLTVVYCPRTHAYFGHRAHPWRKLLEQGGKVALGTDGRGSNPDLSLWEELVFLRRQFPDVAPAMILELGSLAGARALGLDDQAGSLTPGKPADLAVVSLSGMKQSDPFVQLFGLGNEIRSVMRAGNWVDRPC